MKNMDEIVLLMPFLDQTPSFANGFALGQIWEQMSEGEKVERQILTECFQQLELMSVHFGYRLEIEDDEDGWIYLTATPIDISSIH